jgi:hypothetical protein
VPRHTVADTSNLRKNGRGRSVNGYWLEEVTAALDDLTTPGLPGIDREAETVTAAAL